MLTSRGESFSDTMERPRLVARGRMVRCSFTFEFGLSSVVVVVDGAGRVFSGRWIRQMRSKYRMLKTDTKIKLKNAAAANGMNTDSTTTPVVKCSRHK